MTHEKLMRISVHFNGITCCVLFCFVWDGARGTKTRLLAFWLFLGGTTIHFAVQQMMFTPWNLQSKP